MNLRSDSLRGIERFIARVSRKTLHRGRHYFSHGYVKELNCVVPDQKYSAVVTGSAEYAVSLDFADKEWSADCSCPMEYDCKHGVAALLELQRRAQSNGANSASKVISFPATKQKREVPQPPSSPLYDKLVESLGRKLGFEESVFIQALQRCYPMARIRPLRESDLSFIDPQGRVFVPYQWQDLDLWSRIPRDDFYLWLHIAWEIRRRKAKWPAFMDGITDLGLIEKVMNNLAREKEIVKWEHWFGEFNNRSRGSDIGILELRLVLLADEGRLHWRTDPKSEFVAMKQTHARRFVEQCERNEITVHPNSLALWSAVYRTWDYDSWWMFNYSRADQESGLNRLLRMPLAPDQVVTADGQPLRRRSEPLRLHLQAPGQSGDDYVLKLMTAEGTPPPPILCTLDGRPTLYLTEDGLFHGPSSEALGVDNSSNIPAAALESTEGLQFLHTSGIAMPERLAANVQKVPVDVTISCGLEAQYPGSPIENLIVSVVAKAPGLATEKLTPRGWEAGRENGSKAKPKTAKGVLMIHERSMQSHFPGVLEQLGVKWNGYPGDWTLRITKKFPGIFVEWLKSLPGGIEVLLDKQLASLRDEPVSGTVSLDIQESAIDWFDLNVALKVEDTTLTPEELKLLLNARGGFVRLGKKGWRRLHFNLSPEEDEQLARLGLNARDFSSEPQRFHVLQLADKAAKRFLGPERVEKIERRVNELKARVAPVLPQPIRAEMRPYQMEGYHFLAYLSANRFGGVLADDMGLGKTLQTLAWLAWLREDGASASQNKNLPSIAVCPKSVMDNWRAEAERFYPNLRVRLWSGEGMEELPAAREAVDLIVMNYSQLRALSPGIANMPWQTAILDEAQYIKNPDSQTAQAARSLKAEHRLALTGTPIENRLLDLWSILAYAMPGALGHRAHFLRTFNVQDDPLARRRLAARVRPFLMRRTKAQVAKELPDRVEEDLFCEMEGEQQALYRAELKRARQLILGLESNKELNEQRFNILTSLLKLRQICCHPALVDGKLHEAASAKMAALEDLLEPLMEEGHKVLIFSQFVTMLDLLRDLVKRREWRHFYLAGDTENRGELVKEFQATEGGAAFLISLKAGGFGLNLTAASYVVLFDSWWNPAVENQAIDRTHRIGQTSKVMAYRLLMRDSIEQKIRALQKQKGALAQDVLGEERFAQSLTLEDLRFLFEE